MNIVKGSAVMLRIVLNAGEKGKRDDKNFREKLEEKPLQKMSFILLLKIVMSAFSRSM